MELSQNNSVVTGVVLSSGKKIKATKEVIVSEGSLLSPKILELSGIGRKDVPAQAGIEQKINLDGVGENLQDHLRIQTTYELQPTITGLDVLRYNQTRAALELELWRQGQTSLYQYSGSCYGFLKWQTAAGNNSKLLQLAQSVVDTSNAIDRMKPSLLSDPASRASDL